jgi:ligand-binding sensor domain-containing protein/two-component sensor histidine kinase
LAKLKSYLPYLFILLSGLFQAQDKSFTYQHYGPEEGLNNTNVWAIKQGGDGLMYFATQNGVYTYDGYNFIKLQARNLKSNFIRNINFNKGNLLISNEDDVLEFDRKTNSVKKFEDLKFDKPADEIIVNGDYVYNLSNQISLSCINLKNKTLYEDELRKKDLLNRAYCIFKSKDNKVYAGRQDGLYVFEGEKQIKIKSLKNSIIYSIAEDPQGNIVVGSDNKITVLNKDYAVVKEYFPKFKAAKTFLVFGEKNINKLTIDKYNRYWFTTHPDNNLYLFENNILYDVFEILNISTTLINGISKDKDENIWVSTFNDGVYFVQNPFLNNFSFTLNEKNLIINEVDVIGDYVITATGNGLYGFNYKNYSSKTLSIPDEVFGEVIYNLASLQNNYYYSKTTGMSKEANLVSGKNLLQFKPINSKYIHLVNSKEALMAEAGTIYKINIASEKILDTIVSYPDYRIKINAMLIKDQKLFIGNSNGLDIVDLNSKSNIKVEDSVFKFPVNHISLINNKIYIAHEGGFSIYEDKKLVTELPGSIKLSAVKKIKAYDNHIWLATLNGLFMCDMDLNPITKYSKSCGLLSNTINDVVFNGPTACIATDRGISVANTKELIEKRFKPDGIQIISYKIDGVEIPYVPGLLKLNASQDNLTIKFSSPIFNKPNKQYFKYKKDKGIFTPFTDFELLLASVESGKHSIQIITSVDNINWSAPVIVDIEKEESFKETAWLYIIVTIAALFLIIVISYFWVKNVKKKAKKRIEDEQQINLLKHQAMNSLLSPHFIFNSLTSIQNYINTNNSLMASEYLAKFSRLIRMIIEKAAQRQITLRDEIVRLNYYLDLEKERFKNKFDFKIEVDDALNIDEISIPNMIIQPHAENSIIHGILPKHEHGTLTISFKKSKKNELLITIEDDGIGLIKAKDHAKSSHKSLGTSTISNILELNSKMYNKRQEVKMEDKSVLNPKHHGTIITITLEL